MKDTGIAYILWLFGLHYLYLGKPFKWMLYFITLGGLGIWTLIDLFRIPKMVEVYNEKSMTKMNEIQRRLYG